MSTLFTFVLFCLSPVAVLAVAVVLEDVRLFSPTTADTDLFARTMTRVLEAEAVDAVDVSPMSLPLRSRPAAAARIAA